eukprot:c18464_g1_i2.p1 GENE.c18464_g1_i2~~c18464_g1_i2.p1  ORF type:complete len:953 (-),score=291.63 c18464_g1_i2:86-2776(-)
MTQAKILQLKTAYSHDFSKIFQLCELVLAKTQSESLITTTLQTLLRFLNWIELGYVFQTNLIDIILKYFDFRQFRVDACKCLIEIAAMNDNQHSPQKIVLLATEFVGRLKAKHMPSPEHLSQLWDSGNEGEEFVRSVALFFTGLFRTHLHTMEAHCGDALLQGLDILILIARVDDWELQKICVDFWLFLSEDIYEYETTAPKVLGSPPHSNRWHTYRSVLSNVRRVIIETMAKPEEVLIVQDESGEIVRESMKNSDVITVYNVMRETLIYLTHLDYDDTEGIMLDKLNKQMNGSEWGWDRLNTLCWAIGSISGAINEDREKHFLVTVIKELLSLCEMKRGKDNKAVVASNIMYVVGQYPMFLKAHWKFLKTVVNKLFEFMHETHPGVQDMACDTFLKITQQCKKKFVMLHPSETSTFVDELLQDNSFNESTLPRPGGGPQQYPFTLRQVIARLEKRQVYAVYEGVGTMISAVGNEEMHRKQTLITMLMKIPNDEWALILQQNLSQPQLISDPDVLARLVHVLKINTSACVALGANFRNQLVFMYEQLLQLYRVHSEMISNAILTQGAVAAQHTAVRAMRTCKREVMKLIETYMKRSDDNTFVCTSLVPPLLECVLADYNRLMPAARNPEVLLLFATIIDKVESAIYPEVPRILASVFECTLQMITHNFEDYPEHRTYFFRLIQAITTHCFDVYLQMSEAQLKLVIDSICWAFKHTDRTNSEMGLSILQTFLQQLESRPNPTLCQAIYQRFYMTFVQEVLYVITDTFHKSGFKQQSVILMHLFSIVHREQLTSPVFDVTQHPKVTSNREFVKLFISNLLITNFPNLTRNQVESLIDRLFQSSNNAPVFKNHLRDFIVELKEFAVDDNKELYDEISLQKQKRNAVPGMSKLEYDGMAD